MIKRAQTLITFLLLPSLLGGPVWGSEFSGLDPARSLSSTPSLPIFAQQALAEHMVSMESYNNQARERVLEEGGTLAREAGNLPEPHSKIDPDKDTIILASKDLPDDILNVLGPPHVFMPREEMTSLQSRQRSYHRSLAFDTISPYLVMWNVQRIVDELVSNALDRSVASTDQGRSIGLEGVLYTELPKALGIEKVIKITTDQPSSSDVDWQRILMNARGFQNQGGPGYLVNRQARVADLAFGQHAGHNHHGFGLFHIGNLMHEPNAYVLVRFIRSAQAPHALQVEFYVFIKKRLRGLSDFHLVSFLPFGSEINGVTRLHQELLHRLLQESRNLRVSVLNGGQTIQGSGQADAQGNQVVEAIRNGSLSKAWSYEDVQQQLGRWHAERLIDVILLHSSLGAGAQALMDFAQEHHIPQRTWVHFGDFNESLLQRAQPVATHSRHVQTMLRQKDIESTILEPIVDMKFWNPSSVTEAEVDALRTSKDIPPRTLVVLTVSQPGVYKNPFQAVRWVHELRKTWPDHPIIVAMATPNMTGAQMQLWVEQARRLGVPIRLLGNLTPEQLRVWYKAADVAVFPTRWETFGRASVEAQLMGTAVLVTRGGGLPETVDPKEGVVVDIQNDKMAVSALHRLLSDDTYRHRVAIAGQTYVQKRFGYDHLPEIIRWIRTGQLPASTAARSAGVPLDQVQTFVDQALNPAVHEVLADLFHTVYPGFCFQSALSAAVLISEEWRNAFPVYLVRGAKGTHGHWWVELVLSSGRYGLSLSEGQYQLDAELQRLYALGHHAEFFKRYHEKNLDRAILQKIEGVAHGFYDMIGATRIREIPVQRLKRYPYIDSIRQRLKNLPASA